MIRWRDVAVILVLLMAPVLAAADPNAGLPAHREPNLPAGPEKIVESIPVALFDFESKAPGNPDLGPQLGDILTARWSAYDQLMLVERKKLQNVLAEMQLNRSGMVESRQAIKVGKLVGARILIFSRAFAVDRDLKLCPDDFMYPTTFFGYGGSGRQA